MIKAFLCLYGMHWFLLAPLYAKTKNEQSINSTILHQLSKDPYWLKLGHYRQKSKNKYKGEVDGPSFYLDQQGRYKPEQELLVTIKLMLQDLEKNNLEQDSVICRYPLRYKWLKKNHLIEVKNFNFFEHCKTFNSWFNRMNAKAAVLVFAGSYLNNPSSMFGHTFLRFKKKTDNHESKALLDNVVNFAASTGSEGGLLYTVKGLFGGYPGVFSSFPYHMKVNEYVNLEARDLWEYHLSLSQEQVNDLLFHLWELSKTYFDYYFIDENCSYFLLSLLEVNHPNHALVKRLPFFTTPVDTIKVLQKNTDWVEKIELRPSYRRIYQARMASLTKKSKKLAYKMIRQKKVHALGHKELDQQRNILDTVIDYEKYNNKNMVPSSFEKQLWLARSLLPASEPVHIKLKHDPAKSHPTMRFGFGGTYHNDNALSADIYFRGAYHDQLNLQQGLNNLSHIEALNGKLSFNLKSKKILIPELNVIRIISLAPFEKGIKKPSWNINLALEESLNEPCFTCRQVKLSVGPGITIGKANLGLQEDKRFLFYTFLNSANALALSDKLNSFVGLEIDSGFLFDFGNLSSQKLGFKYAINALNNFLSHEQAYFLQAFHLNPGNEIRVDFNYNLHDYNAALYYLRYF
mgnify:CR=1 FL=1